MQKRLLNIATCQFGVTADIDANASAIQDMMTQSADKNAGIVHFSECALSGYASVDFESFEGYDWNQLRNH